MLSASSLLARSTAAPALTQVQAPSPVATFSTGARHKGAKKFRKFRPIKHCLSDKNRKPHEYPAPPPRPAEFVVVGKGEENK
mmetsp:Transcript_24136/g.62370  ORF Transcript_24136/g.62370 Transcript_24136/m.62370 type:complete len:82 (+) Transcript_24136:111-356(+)